MFSGEYYFFPPLKLAGGWGESFLAKFHRKDFSLNSEGSFRHRMMRQFYTCERIRPEPKIFSLKKRKLFPTKLLWSLTELKRQRVSLLSRRSGHLHPCLCTLSAPLFRRNTPFSFVNGVILRSTPFIFEGCTKGCGNECHEMANTLFGGCRHTDSRFNPGSFSDDMEYVYCLHHCFLLGDTLLAVR